MPCLVHLQCSGCCCPPAHDIAGGPGPGCAVELLIQNRRAYPVSAGWCRASHGATQRRHSVRAGQATADELTLSQRPERPSRAKQQPQAEPQPPSRPETPTASGRLKTPLPPAPLTSSSDRAPPQQRHVYWRGSVTSREAVLGRRLLSSNGQASIASVLQGEMLSSKQITRCLPSVSLAACDSTAESYVPPMLNS